MKALPRIAFYDPNRLDPDEFLAGFVARQDVADFLLDKLRRMKPRDAADHQVIIGQRGMGKTSLLRRLAIGITRDGDLSQRYTPLTFREEQYNVRSLDRFWRNCGEALAEWYERRDEGEIAAQLDQRLLAADWCDSRTAGDAFLAEAKVSGRRPILLVDNLDIILNALPADDHWTLRRTLQKPDGPILYGAATQFLRQTQDKEAAFYEFFQPHLLEALSAEELLRCLHRLSDNREQAGKVVRDILVRDPGRLKTLHTLSGGNPRILAFVYMLLERADSNTVFSDLEALLDQLTPFYKARVEEYPTDLQRAVIDAVALNWDPIGSHDLSEVTGVEITTISSQLARFRNDGLIEQVSTSGARAGYQLVERLFNIWYLMRHGTRRTRQKVFWLTAFLKNFYAPDELTRLRSEADRAGDLTWHPLFREALAAAVENLSMTIQATVPERHSSTLRAHETGEIKAVSSPSSGEARGNDAKLLVDEGNRLGALGRNEEAIAVYDEVVRRFETASEAALREQVARALFNKGVRLGMLGRGDEEIAVYDEVVRRFETASEAALREPIASALLNKGFRLGELGRGDEEIALYDEVVRRFETASEAALREPVAWALVNKGGRLGTLGRGEEAIAVYDEVVRRFETASEAALREPVAWALVNKGGRLGTLGRGEEAIAVYDEVVRRFETASEAALREQVAWALFNKGIRLGVLGRSEEAIGVYDEVVRRFETASEAALREQVAWALFNKGIRLGVLGRSEEAIGVYDEVVRRFETASEAALREQVAWALFNKGIRLGVLGRSEEAIGVYDEVVRRFETASEAALREPVAWALQHKGRRLIELERSEEAAQAYRQSLEVNPNAKGVWVSLGNCLADHLGRYDEAEAAYRNAVASAESAPFAKANLIWLLVITDRRSEATALRSSLETLDPVGLSLIDAALEVSADNFGAAVKHLEAALNGDSPKLATIFFDDLLRFLRIVQAREFGERLIAWFQEKGEADRRAPIYAAFVAFVRGERFLLDFSPEVRFPAEKIFRWLIRRRVSSSSISGTESFEQKGASKRRGRPPKRRGN